MDERPQLLIPFFSLIDCFFCWFWLPVERAFGQIHQVCEEVLQAREAQAFSRFQVFQRGSPLPVGTPEMEQECKAIWKLRIF